MHSSPFQIEHALAAEIGPSLQHRLVIWQFAAERIQEGPWLGWGLDTARHMPGGGRDAAVYLAASGLTVPDAARSALAGFEVLPLHPHNDPLELRHDRARAQADAGAI